MPCDAPELCPLYENDAKGPNDVEVNGYIFSDQNSAHIVKETKSITDHGRTPTQCTDDVLDADWDLHQQSASGHVHAENTDNSDGHIKGGVTLYLDDTDLPMRSDRDSPDYQVDLKYVEENELGLQYKDENTKEKASTPDTDHERDGGGFPLDLSVYLKNPIRHQKSFHTPQVYMLHSTAAQTPLNTGTNKEAETAAQFSLYRSSEIMRLPTYNDFPQNIPVFVSRLVSSGFIYRPDLALLECCFCQLHLPPIEFVGVAPNELHKRKSPGCPHMSRVELGNGAATAVTSGSGESTLVAATTSASVGRDCATPYQASVATVQPSPAVEGNRVPPERRPEAQPDSRPSQMSEMPTASVPASVSPNRTSSSAAGPMKPKAKTEAPKEKKKLTYSDLGIFAEKPKRPEMAVVQKRMASFQGKWKQDYTQTPKMLADAGMYYAGYGDCARCFFCGGGLKNWEPPDSPWIEHARWFPKCGYVRMCKGQMFVDIVQRKNREKQEITLKEVEDEINEKTGEPRDTEPTAPGVPASDVSPSKITERDLRERGEDASHIPGQQVPDLEVLENENEELKAEIMCKICMDRESAVVFLPCGHLVSCTHCAHALQQCPLCRAEIKGSVRAHMG